MPYRQFIELTAYIKLKINSSYDEINSFLSITSRHIMLINYVESYSTKSTPFKSFVQSVELQSSYDYQRGMKMQSISSHEVK